MSTQSKNYDDLFPGENPYAWGPNSSASIEEFLSKYKPSMVQNDGTKPWIWVQGKNNVDIMFSAEETSAVDEASEFLQKTTERIEEIKNDSTIPVRSSKKTGARSKKEVREEVQSEATETLEGISKKHGYVHGKWQLIFAPSDRVDAIWASVASSLVSGPLAATVAVSAKVATSPEYETQGYQHVICVYIPDVYDKENVTEVMKVLVRRHGLNLSGVKSDLYTLIGLDSKHPSGIPSTVWKNSAVLSDSEIKGLKKEYFSESAAAKVANKPVDGKVVAPRKPALKKRKVGSDDPFVSDDDNDGTESRHDVVKRDVGHSGKNKNDSVDKAEVPTGKKRKVSP